MTGCTPGEAKSPFDDKTADIILRSSDSIHFYVNQFVLSLASPIFRDMFELGKPVDPDVSPPLALADSCSRPSSRHQIIDVSEPSSTLDLLLRFCYPVEEPKISQVSDVANVLRTASKYEMSFLFPRLLTLLGSMVDTNPLGVFAVACHHKDEALAKAAATQWKSKARNKFIYVGPTTSWFQTLVAESFQGSEEMKGITAGELYRLLGFISTSGENGEVIFCSRDGERRQEDSQHREVHRKLHVDSLLSRIRPDIILQSTDGLSFRSNSALLSLASPLLAPQITTCLDDSQTIRGNDDLPLLIIPENGKALEGFLALCYAVGSGSEDPTVLTPFLSVSAIRLATKFDSRGVINLAKRLLQKQMAKDPLDAYFTFARLGWKAECRESAVLFSRIPTPTRTTTGTQGSEKYNPQMEDVSAEVYYHLLRFRHQYRGTVCSALPDTQLAFSRWNEATSLLFGEDSTAKESKLVSPEVIYGILVSRALSSNKTRFGSRVALGPEVQHWNDVSSRVQRAVSKVRLFHKMRFGKIPTEIRLSRLRLGYWVKMKNLCKE